MEMHDLKYSHHGITRSALSLAIAMALSPYAAAQNEAPQSKKKSFEEEIVVSAAGFEQKIPDAPASISVISQDELLSRPHPNLTEMLRYQEGIDIGSTRDKSGQATVSMRGLSGEYTLLLIDGKRQNNHGDIYPNSFGGNAFGHMPPTESIERIEIIRGPASTLYGADAMGGVINVITKKVADEWHGAVNLGGTFQENSDFGDQHQGNFYVSGPLIPNVLSLGLRGTYNESKSSTPQFDPVVDPNGDVHIRSLGFGGGGKTVDSTTEELGLTLTWKIDERQSLRFDYDTSAQVYDNTPNIDSKTGTISYPLGTKDNIDELWKSGRSGYAEDQEFTRDWWSITHEGSWNFGTSYVSLSYVDTDNKGRTVPLSAAERLLLKDLQTSSGPYAGMSEAERKSIAESTLLPRPGRTLNSNQYTLDANLTIPLEGFGSHIIVAGTQIIDGELEDGVFGSESGQIGGVQDHKMWSLFVEDSWSPIQPLTITAGLRYDEHDTFGSQVSPRLYGVYALTDTWTLKGGVSTGYKTPNTTDLYDGITGFGGQGTSPFAGNPDLEPETSVNSEIALYWNSMDGHNFNVTYFNTQFEDKIASGEGVDSCEMTGGVRPCVNLGTYGQLGYDTYRQKINIDKVELQGVEIAGRYNISSTWSLQANYTWTDSEQKSGPQKGQPLNDTAEHMGNISLDWQALDNLSFTLQAEIRSDRYRDWDTTLDRALYFKNYELFNLGMRYNITDNLTLFARINNLLDEDLTTYTTAFTDVNGDGIYDTKDNQEVRHIDDYNNKDAGRNYWMSLQYTF